MTTLELWRLKIVCRWSLGFVWIWEGLVPKILGPTAMQRDLVVASGWYWPDPDRFTICLGLVMIVAGIAICAGFLERPPVLTASIAMTILIFLVVDSTQSQSKKTFPKTPHPSPTGLCHSA
jgi:uncharacterized membrane protein YphA (DoxX/SURF4 family)